MQGRYFAKIISLSSFERKRPKTNKKIGKNPKEKEKRKREGMYGLEVVVQKLRSVTECKVTRVLVRINVQIMFQTVIDKISLNFWDLQYM